jgi:drug/metabolite transporter (DMT)-like permease
MSFKKINPSPPPALSERAKERPKSITWPGWLLAFCTSLAFSLAAPVGRAAILSGMDPTELLIGRFGFGTLLIWLTLVVRPSKRAPLDFYGMGSIALVGLLNGIGMLFFFSALTRLDASISSMILSTVPILVLLILAFRGEPLTQRKVIRLVLAMTGLYVLIGPGGDLDMIGVTLAMIAVLFFAAQFVLSQSLMQKYDTETVARYVMTAMLVVISAYWWLQDGAWQWPSLQGWFYIGLLAVISSYAARLLLYATIRRIGSGQTSLMIPLETLMSISWAALFLSERLTPIQWLGGALIVSSAVLAIERIKLGSWD